MDKEKLLRHYQRELDLMLKANIAGLRDGIEALETQVSQINRMPWLYETEHFHAAIPGLHFAIGVLEARIEELS
jgi:hypothetical protein